MGKHLSTGVSSLGARLKALGFSSYAEYLNSDHWREYRNRVYTKSKAVKKMLQRWGYIGCQACKSRGQLYLHHKTYKRLGKEWLGDVFILCGVCHDDIHRLYNQRRQKGLWKPTHKIFNQKRKQWRHTACG